MRTNFKDGLIAVIASIIIFGSGVAAGLMLAEAPPPAPNVIPEQVVYPAKLPLDCLEA